MILIAAGYQVVRAARLKHAMNIAGREHIDAAILDVNLHGKRCIRSRPSSTRPACLSCSRPPMGGPASLKHSAAIG